MTPRTEAGVLEPTELPERGQDAPERGQGEPGQDKPGQDERTWTVGELADELGVTTRTLRHYEAEGLVLPGRSGSGRVYTHRDRARLRLILRGKRFGMSLPEIREIVGMYDGAASSERRQLQTLLSRLGEITEDLKARQADLSRTLAEVTDVAERCRDRLAELPAASPHRGAANPHGEAANPTENGSTR